MGVRQDRDRRAAHHHHRQQPKDTDSWFVGYAPAPGAKAVAAAPFPEQGYGATTAAPPRSRTCSRPRWASSAQAPEARLRYAGCGSRYDSRANRS